MASVQLNPGFTNFSGRMGNIVLYRIGTDIFARRYVVPKNPDTVNQRANRSLFASAIKAWQCLPIEEKNGYNRISSKKRNSRNGYCLFISMFIKQNSVNPEASSKPVKALPSAIPGVYKAFTFDASPLGVRFRFDSAGVTEKAGIIHTG